MQEKIFGILCVVLMVIAGLTIILSCIGFCIVAYNYIP